MLSWTVVVEGRSREVYLVEAETEEEALEKWPRSQQIVCEIDDVKVASITPGEGVPGSPGTPEDGITQEFVNDLLN